MRAEVKHNNHDNRLTIPRKGDLIYLQPRVHNDNFHETGLPIHGNFL